MRREDAKSILGDVRAYLASRASLENESLAGHSFIEICNAIKTLKQEPKTEWIPVGERLPQMKEQVLCCEKDKVFIGCMVFEYDGVPVFSKSNYKHFYVTAWMPLPEPYKAESEVEE